MDALYTRLYVKPGYSEQDQCWIYQGNTKKDGYAYVTFRKPGKEKPVTSSVQRVSLMILRQSFDLPEGDASHLCHNRLCVRHSHISLEPRSVNTQRRTCVREKKCLHHPKEDGGYFPDCLIHGA